MSPEAVRDTTPELLEMGCTMTALLVLFSEMLWASTVMVPESVRNFVSKG